ncbi:Chromatin structure-remodeling complex protein rsc9 [Myotisia sp. PD_48]|nr:Chromatin structure-remodeling complex protein rsc9 [Myotisia sp. PD_48]
MDIVEHPTPSNRRGVFAPSSGRAHTLPANVDPIMTLALPDQVPNIYRFCWMGIRSDVDKEVDFALHHLIVISDERGDKLKFCDFTALAESLVEQVLKVSLLVHGRRWNVEMDHPEDVPFTPANTIFGLTGTPNLLDRIQAMPVILDDATVEDDEFCAKLQRVNQAALIIRNMCMLEDNAHWFHEEPILRDCATIVFNLPAQDRFMELKNNFLEIVEQACPFWELWDEDPLYQSLVNIMETNDRFQLTAAMKCLCLFAIERIESKIIDRIPSRVLEKIMRLTLLIQDQELLSTSLDFLYQFSRYRVNVLQLVKDFNLAVELIPHLVSLLNFDSRVQNREIIDQEERKEPAPTEVPVPHQDLYRQLAQFQEPERCARWLKCCFVEDHDCEITQLAIWQAYQACFSPNRIPGLAIADTMQATDFISTVSNTFSMAQAKVVEGPSARFIIRGIRPLETTYNLDGFPNLHCLWGKQGEVRCDHVYIDPAVLRAHVFQDHLRLKALPSGGWDFESSSGAQRVCHWDYCTEYEEPTSNMAQLSGHVSSHLPPLRDMSKPPPIPPRAILQPKRARTFKLFPTPVDDHGEPYGIAFKALLVMRYILTGLPTTLSGPKHGNLPWPKVVFGSQRKNILERATLNPSLTKEIFEFMNELDP